MSEPRRFVFRHVREVETFFTVEVRSEGLAEGADAEDLARERAEEAWGLISTNGVHPDWLEDLEVIDGDTTELSLHKEL